MKKLSLLIGGVILSTAVMAQKPTDGAPMSLEGQLSLGLGTGSGISFAAPAIRFRYWVTENIAARVTFGISNSSTTTNPYLGGNLDSANGTYKTMMNGWNGAVGAEYHFAGTDRLSPYVGLDLAFAGGAMKTEGTDADGPGSYNADYSETTSTPYSSIGFSLLAGTDYYFAENFYIGLEMGLYWMSTTNKQGDVKITDSTPSVDVSGPARAESKMSSLAVAPVGNFRLGWRF